MVLYLYHIKRRKEWIEWNKINEFAQMITICKYINYINLLIIIAPYLRLIFFFTSHKTRQTDKHRYVFISNWRKKGGEESARDLNKATYKRCQMSTRNCINDISVQYIDETKSMVNLNFFFSLTYEFSNSVG